MSSWVTIGIEFIKTLAGPGKGRSRPRTDNSTAGGGLASGADVRPESQTSIKTKDSPNQQELGGLASGAESIVVRPGNQPSTKTEDSPNQQELEGLASSAESIVVRPGNQPSTKTEDTPNQQELERRRKIVRQFFNDFWRSADAKPVTFAERLNLAEGYINERLVTCGEAWQLDSAVRKQLGLPPHSHHPIRGK
jgi:predicted component of type VI protein secretion system